MRVAERFFAQAGATFVRLAGMPGIGTPFEPDEPLLADLRCFPVARFRDYIIFYRPIPGGIEVFRVLHGARDIHGILAAGSGLNGDDDRADQVEE